MQVCVKSTLDALRNVEATFAAMPGR
jgi:hypothetical protein